MIHRHLDYDPSAPLARRGRAAIDDILDRGDLDDWAPLAEAIAADPDGTLASAVLEICNAHPMYGTSALWQTWISRLRREARLEDAVPALSLAELRRRRGHRQADVSAEMGIAQPDVSKMEARRDIRLSSLDAYVAATGGRLVCLAVYSDEQVELQVAARRSRRSLDV